MKKPQTVYSLKTIALGMGVDASRIAAITKVFEDNRHDASLLFQCIRDPTLLSDKESTAIMTYIGAVIAGQAFDDKLDRPIDLRLKAD